MADNKTANHPVFITQEEYYKECDAFWSCRQALATGSITKSEYLAVAQKHKQFMNDIFEEKIVVAND